MPPDRSILPDAYAYIPVYDNPTPHAHPFFEDAIRRNLDPYWIAKAMELTLDFERPELDEDEDQPTPTKLWTWQRHGHTVTNTPDGRKIYIGGEHEDWYDPMFVIFNDVVVYDPKIHKYALYRYPKSVFPPTDFHTATHVEADNSIWIIGGLSYAHLRKTETPVHRLDLTTLSIHKVDIEGPSPGWIWGHTAYYLQHNDSIVEGEDITDSVIRIKTNPIKATDDKPAKPSELWELSTRQKKWRCLSMESWHPLPERPSTPISSSSDSDPADDTEE